MREWLRGFRARNPEKCKLYRSRQWSHQKPQKLFYKYRVTKEEQDARMAEQGGKCAICGDHPDKKPLQLDHDHESGKMRGWLCFRCNRGLGMFRDNPEAIERAAEYLRRAKGVSEVA